MTNILSGEDQTAIKTSLPVANRLAFSLEDITDYCNDCDEWKEVEPIIKMSNKLMRHKATEQDYELLDNVEKSLKKRSFTHNYHNPHITMERPHINGPIYEIRDNEHINLNSDGSK